MYSSFDEYLESIERDKDKLPAHVYEFASDPERHILNSPHSLHDAWLTSLTIKENRKKERPFEPHPYIEVVFLGQMHDRDIVLEYIGIERYELSGNKNPLNSGDTFHGDVAAHEVRIESGLIVHEIEFASESKIVIACKDFTCKERMHA